MFWFVGFVCFFVFWFLHSETKIPKRQNQKNKIPKLFRHSQRKFVFFFFVWVLWWFHRHVKLCCFGFFDLGLLVVPQTRSEGSNSIPRKKHERACASDVLKGMVCHGGDHIYIYIDISISIYIYIYGAVSPPRMPPRHLPWYAPPPPPRKPGLSTPRYSTPEQGLSP